MPVLFLMKIIYKSFNIRVGFFTNPDFAYENNRFDLDDLYEMNDDECKAEFGVRKCHTCETFFIHCFICCRNNI